MDVSYLISREGTDPIEYKAGIKVEMEKIIVGKDNTVKGIPGAMHGKNYRPWFDYTSGLVGCTCPAFEEGLVLYCRHIIGLLNSLTKDNVQYGEQFFVVLKQDDFSSLKTESGFVKTWIESVDDLLGGGIPRAAVAFLVGPTKVGKTWFCIQLAFQCAMNGVNVLYIDTEGMFNRQDGFGAFEKHLRSRFKYEGNLSEHLFFMQQSELKDVGKLFGYAIYINKSGRKVEPIVNQEYDLDDTPIYNFCKQNKIDIVIFDSLSDMLKGEMSSDTQNLPARSTIINKLYPSFEKIARDRDLAFIIINHASRDTRYFKLYTDKDGKGILDERVTNENVGIFGSSAITFNIKYLYQMENCTRDWAKTRNIVHFMRRLTPGQANRHVDLEFIDDFGFKEYS